MKELYYIKTEVIKEEIIKQKEKIKEGKIKGKNKKEIEKIKDKNQEKLIYIKTAKQLIVPQLHLILEKIIIQQEKNKKESLYINNKKFIKSNRKFIKLFTSEFLNFIYDEFMRCSFYQYKTINDYNKIILIFEDESEYILMLPSTNLRGKQLVELYNFKKDQLIEYLR